jgi:LEA14-like dessication related protein
MIAGREIIRAARLLAIALGLTAAGCALVMGEPPEVQVASIELRDLGLPEQALQVQLCVTNPNRTVLAFRRVSVVVDVAGAPLAAGQSELPVRLPPLTSTLVPFAVATTVANLAPQLLSVLGSGELRYRLHGAVTLTGAPEITLPFSRAGRLDLLTVGQDVLGDAAASSRCSAGGGA